MSEPHPLIYKYPIRYPKINTLWKRDKIRKVKRKGLIMPGQYSEEAFKTIKYWTVKEKVHGENVRIFINFIPGNASPPIIWIGSRNDTDNLEISDELMDYINRRLEIGSLRNAFTKGCFSTGLSPRYAMIFGEGYGGNIHHGHNYNDTEELVVFDILLDGWWLEPNNVTVISAKLGFKTVPTFYSPMELDEIISYVKSEPDSRLAIKKHTIEGVVCQTLPILLTRKGYPLKFKLKVKDFRDLKNMEEENEN